VRRSCDTERRTAVFISSLRRNAAVSTTSACNVARCSAADRIDSSAGTTRAATRSRSSINSVAGSSRVPQAQTVTTVGATTPSMMLRSLSGSATSACRTG